MLVSFNCIFRSSYESLPGIATLTNVLELSDRDLSKNMCNNKCIELLIPLLHTLYCLLYAGQEVLATQSSEEPLGTLHGKVAEVRRSNSP